MPHTISEEMRRCIDECQSCREVCLETVSHCLKLGGKHAESGHITTLLDCAGICTTSAEFMLRGSEQHGAVCGVCAEVCDRCAASCEAIGEDEMMARCAEECRRCAESCRKMARHGARA